MIPGMYDGRNKTFFFASYEGHRRQQGVVDVSNVPSAAQRQRETFSGLAPIFDPLTTTTGTVTRTQFCRQPDSSGSHLAAGAVLHAVHPAAECRQQHVRVEPDHVEFNQNQVTLAPRSGDQLAAPLLHALQPARERRRTEQDRWDTLGATRLEGPGVQPRHVADVELRVVAGPRSFASAGCTASTVRRPTSRARASDLVQQQAGVRGLDRHSGSHDRQPAGVHVSPATRVFRAMRATAVQNGRTAASTSSPTT